MKPSLLIVVPTLNSYVLLTRLVGSLQQQTWPNWRLLFIDGPSSLEHRNWLVNCCAKETRCRWILQDAREPGIFGAMNQGFALCGDPSFATDWLLFWGSDDWASSPTVLAKLMAQLDLISDWPDLLVCRGRYADTSSGVVGRPTAFHPAGILSTNAYRSALLFGSTPPHQATLFGAGARKLLDRYSPGYRLSADLDYFLQLSSCPDLRVKCLDLELVHIGSGGVSGQQIQLRLKEVGRAYRRAFGWRWWFPFVLRYLRRMATLLER